MNCSERLENNLECHGQSDRQSDQETQTPGWLWKWQLVGNGVENARHSEQAEMPDSSTEAGSNGNVEQSSDEECGDVL